MRVWTHILFTVLCLLFYLNYFSVEHIFLFGAIALFTTLFVDIDEPDSTIGKRLWPFAKIINIIFGHRGLFHSILIPLLFYFLLGFFHWEEIGRAVLLGYSSHLMMDMLTPHGIYPLYPLKWRIRGPIPVGSVFEYVLLFFLLVIILIVFIL